MAVSDKSVALRHGPEVVLMGFTAEWSLEMHAVIQFRILLLFFISKVQNNYNFTFSFHMGMKFCVSLQGQNVAHGWPRTKAKYGWHVWMKEWVKPEWRKIVTRNFKTWSLLSVMMRWLHQERCDWEVMYFEQNKKLMQNFTRRHHFVLLPVYGRVVIKWTLKIQTALLYRPKSFSRN